MAREKEVRMRLTDERMADLEEAAKSYGVAPATMATVIIGEWLDKRKREDAPKHPLATKVFGGHELYVYLDATMFKRPYTGQHIVVTDNAAWIYAREHLLDKYADGYRYTQVRDWIDQTVAPRIRVENT